MSLPSRRTSVRLCLNDPAAQTFVSAINHNATLKVGFEPGTAENWFDKDQGTQKTGQFLIQFFSPSLTDQSP